MKIRKWWRGFGHRALVVGAVVYMTVTHILARYHLAPPLTEFTLAYFDVSPGSEYEVYTAITMILGVVFFALFIIFVLVIRRSKRRTC